MAHPQIIMNDPVPMKSYTPSQEIIDPFEMNTVRIEHKGDQTIYHYAQDISAVQNNNEEERKDGVNDNQKEFRKVASIPWVVWNMWENMGITQDQRELRKALERHRHELKTTEKKLI